MEDKYEVYLDDAGAFVVRQNQVMIVKKESHQFLSTLVELANAKLRSSRYWCFSGLEFYPNGGMKDLMNVGDSIERLVEEWKQKSQVPTLFGSFYQWCHVVDMQTRTVVDAWEYEPSDRGGKFLKLDLSNA